MAKIDLEKIMDHATDKEVRRLMLGFPKEGTDYRKAYTLLLDKGSDGVRLWLIDQLLFEGMYDEAVDLYEACKDRICADEGILDTFQDGLRTGRYETVCRFAEALISRGYNSLGEAKRTSLFPLFPGKKEATRTIDFAEFLKETYEKTELSKYETEDGEV